MLIPVQMSGFVLVFYSKIFEIVKFDPLEDILHFDALVKWIMGLEDQPISAQAEQLGYGSKYAIINLGAIYVYLVILMTILLVMLIVVKIVDFLECENGKVRTLVSRQFQKLKWNGAIRLFNELYTCLCFSVAINLHNGFEAVRFDSFKLLLNSLFALVTGISLVVVPVCVIYALCKHWAPVVRKANILKYSN